MKTSTLKMIATFATAASLMVGNVAFAKSGGSSNHSGGSSNHSSGSSSHSGGSSSHSSGSSKSSSGSVKSSSNSSKSSNGSKSGSNSSKTTSNGSNKSTSTNGSKTNGSSGNKTTSNKKDSNKTTSTNGNKTSGNKNDKTKTSSTNGSKNGKDSKKNDNHKHSKHDIQVVLGNLHKAHDFYDNSCYSGYCGTGYGCYSQSYCESYGEPCCYEESCPVYGEQSAPVYSEETAPVAGSEPVVEDETQGETSSSVADSTEAGSDDDAARTKVPAGSTLLVDGQNFGSKAGTARLRIGGGLLKIKVAEWTADSVKVSLPKADQAGATNADLEIVRADGTVASRTSLEVESVEQVASNN